MPTLPEPPIKQEFAQELQQALPNVSFDRITRLLYSTDASIYQMMPVGVVFPRAAADVATAMDIAGRHTVPVLPRGGGSSLAGQAVGHALVLDFSRYMDQVLELNVEQATVRVQPGITLGKLNRILQPHGLMFGPDPASADRATMGGILGNNATGSHSIIYGMASDHILAAETILSDGTILHTAPFDPSEWAARGDRSGREGILYRSIARVLEHYAEPIQERFPHTFRTVAGYNLQQLAASAEPNLTTLLVGSEGSLGIVTEMTLKLVPIPRIKQLVLVQFDDLLQSLEFVPELLKTDPAAVELIDKFLLDLVRNGSEFKDILTFIQGDPQAVLVLEYAGDDEASIHTAIDRLRTCLKSHYYPSEITVIEDPADQENVWNARIAGLGILMSMRGDAKPLPFIEDATVPVEHLAEYVRELSAFVSEVGVDQMAIYAHASAGCLHIRPILNLKTRTGIHQMRQIAEKSVSLIIRYGGSTSGEHGEGLARGEFSQKLFGHEITRAFHEVKRAFDPENLMNPGKVVNVPAMDKVANLRYGPFYETPSAIRETVFSFEKDFGFAGAVEMCSGSGECRQLDGGVMCPSFQATRDEANSTRGRANILRAAMMGLLGPNGMISQEVYDVMDLCLSCHACKSECPSAVDMAKLKAEFLHNYYTEHGIPVRSWLFGNIAQINRLGQPLAPLANLALRGPVKWAMTALGVHPARSMPLFTRQPFSKWFKLTHIGQQNDPASAANRQVIFFHDTFMEHNHPEVGQAAIRVLEAAGYQPVVLEDRKCCGRPAISKGLLDEASKNAHHNVELLAPYARRGLPIVGLEPSCMAMLVDEYLDLVPGEDAQIVAAQTMMLDQFLVQEAQQGNLQLDFDDSPRKVLFHGHCQQKTTFGTQSTHAMLGLIPNCTVEEIEAGCCGMAGSFGYEKEHYALSIQIAELALAPAVRAAADDTIICAMGTSCRDQTEHTTGRKALHPIQVLADALRSDPAA